MQSLDLYSIMIFLIPTLSSLFMLTILGWDIIDSNKSNRQPKKWLFCYLLSWMLSLLLFIFYFFISDLFVYLNWLFYTVLLIQFVFFYHFIFDITKPHPNNHFSHLHYVVPVFVALLMLILLFYIPYDAQLHIIKNASKSPDGYGFFNVITHRKIYVKILVDIIYMIACLVCLKRYGNFIINYSSNESRSSLSWIYQYVWMSILLLGTLVFGIALPLSPSFPIALLSIPLILVTFLQIYLVYHTIKGHYYLISDSDDTKIAIIEKGQTGMLKKSLLTKTYFNEYMDMQQPYLNPDLKITDMVKDLQVNRTYISGFINREYNMNFSQYINQCRLNEYYRLLADPVLKNKSTEELCALAGFSSYRYFLRLEKEQGYNKN